MMMMRRPPTRIGATLPVPAMPWVKPGTTCCSEKLAAWPRAHEESNFDPLLYSTPVYCTETVEDDDQGDHGHGADDRRDQRGPAAACLASLALLELLLELASGCLAALASCVHRSGVLHSVPRAPVRSGANLGQSRRPPSGADC